ncbi:MAG: hypothetical protein SAK29_38415 [Scytonema sp. PMC 1069.18]|nr:hypothetical protein [Scytonema sp. PMC 1069.18]MEC4881280.1 hypothetical protein [Scytonema sp. PMC 1070.18]
MLGNAYAQPNLQFSLTYAVLETLFSPTPLCFLGHTIENDTGDRLRGAILAIAQSCGTGVPARPLNL